MRPIHNVVDQGVALAEIDSLKDAVPGTAEGDRWDVLVTLAVMCESPHRALYAPDPTGAIRIRMERKTPRTT
jgi:HTH-type transcriptional regulator / antitoxin HigA